MTRDRERPQAPSSRAPAEAIGAPADWGSPAFLRQQARELLDFYVPRVINPAGGYFTQIDDDGTVYDRDVDHLVHTCRYAHGFAQAHRFGLLDQGADLAAHGIAFLRRAFHDPVNGGYYWTLEQGQPVDRRKLAYGHAFVLLAAASAVQAGIADGADLLADAADVLETRFWDPAARLYVDEISPDWTVTDPYRGQNANMHLVEAYLQAYLATGDEAWLDWAELVSHRVMVDLTALTGDTLWEHYDDRWVPDLDYNRATPRDLFRPFGVLPGHLLEWTKLLSQLEQARPSPWAAPVARRSFAQALSNAWDREYSGFIYAYDLAGTVVDDAKYHWVIAEAIGAAAMLAQPGADPMYGRWYDRFWAYAMRHQVDRERGGWYPTLTRQNQRLELSFTRGKSDFYHPLGAILLTLSLAEARERGDNVAR